MTIHTGEYSKFLEKVAQEIDIPPSKYQDAVDRYKSVGHWLQDAEYSGCSGEPNIYPQGSFRLGTVVRPVRGGLEADYDIDLVCELPIAKHWTDARSVKMMVGNRLFEHGKYRKMFDKEGKRCWTLKYAEQDGIGFHLDVLPSVPDPSLPGSMDTSIAITNKQGEIYDWSASNPSGYGEWFDDRNKEAFNMVVMEQKRSIQSRTSMFYASVDEVPDELVRTSLQRSVQIMKRHRDLKFSNSQNNAHMPISIVITTLAAQLYQGEPDIYSAFSGIVSRLYAYAGLVDNKFVNRTNDSFNLIRRTSDGKWYIGNPVNPDENFADRWHEDNHARARAFFFWVETLKEDLIDILIASRPETVHNRLSLALGASVVSSHSGLLTPTPATFSPPKVHITKAAKPWGFK